MFRYLESMFAGWISPSQGCPDDASHAANSHNTPRPLLHHVRQDLLGEGDGAEEVELHQGIINIIAGLQAQWPLATAPVINQDIDLKLYTVENEKVMTRVMTTYI